MLSKKKVFDGIIVEVGYVAILMFLICGAQLIIMR